MSTFNKHYQAYLKTHDSFSVRCPLSEMDKLVRRREYREFSERFKAVFAAVRSQNLHCFADQEQEYFHNLFDLWFRVMEKDSFQFEDGDEIYFNINANIANLLAVTGHRNGDASIKRLIGKDNNMAKLLLLYTPRSRLEIPLKPLFDANPAMASLWYASLWNWCDTYISPVVQQNCEYFLENVDDRFLAFDSDLICGYFRCTYVNNLRDRILKRVFNRAVNRCIENIVVRNAPNPKSIAVVSAYWDGSHAVYRSFAPYVERLAAHYDLTLINLKESGKREPERSFFKRVVDIEASPQKIELSGVLRNDFQIAYYPDVGMSQESIYLANIRLAPIQCMGTGHPVSSASPVMDYFISGGEVETRDSPEENYDERLVLLPGLSVHPVKPKYAPAFPEPPEDFIINLPWMHMKNNYRMTTLLRRIVDSASRKVVFSFFPGCAVTMNASFMATVQDLAGILPMENFAVQRDMDYIDYMRLQEMGRFTLHSFPFGGGTTAVDALILGKPLVVLRGRHEYNRFAASLLKRIDLEELVADDEDQWLRVCLRLIEEPDYLATVTARIRATDLDELLFRVSDADMLRRAFDHLIRHDAALRRDADRKPIWID